MHDTRSHPLLEQVPLTVSPFVRLPTATTLPYTYKAMPSTLPPSASGVTSATRTSQPPRDGGAGTTPPPHHHSTTTAADPAASSNSSSSYMPPSYTPPPQPRYVVSAASGHAAHPDEIIASCRALQAHTARLQADAEVFLRRMDDNMRARDLAEKRRVAPGWLDSDERMLEPERKPGAPMTTTTTTSTTATTHQEDTAAAREARWSSLAGYGGSGSGADMMERVEGTGLEGEGGNTGAFQPDYGTGGPSEMAVPDEGEELDRAFGAMTMGKERG